MNEKTGRIGEHKGTAYYLLYTPDAKKEAQPLDTRLAQASRRQGEVPEARRLLRKAVDAPRRPAEMADAKPAARCGR